MIEQAVLSALTLNEEYARKTLPFIKDDYFDDGEQKFVFLKIQEFVQKYNGLPTKEALHISTSKDDTLNEDRYKKITGIIDGLNLDPKTDINWLVDETEKFCQDKAIYNAVRQSILILDGKDKVYDRGSIPELLSKALGVSFDSSIGHDFLENIDERYSFYHTKEDKIAFDLELMNKITKGGVSRKSLSIALAGTGVGKTLFMTHCAAANLMNGMNVLYITMEMAEEKIAERIDANLLDLTLDDLREIDRTQYDKRIGRVRSRTAGKLIIKEYPTASAGSAHFRHLLNELRLKKNFVPDIIYIDYLNICMSSRMKHGGSVNSYTYIKAIAEEIRGLAVEFNVPIVSATQTTRSGYSNSDVDLTDTSESFGLPATADFMFALISSEEMEELGQIMVKQLKNRWGDINYYKRFVVGIDRSKMRLFDVEQKAQDDIVNEKPEKSIMDDTDFGTRMLEEKSMDDFAKFKKNKKPKAEGWS